MAYENTCLYCFSDNGGRDVCPHCGRDARAAVPQAQLMPGTAVYNERFLVGRAVGQDASGIVYGALDTKRGVKLRVREYLPRDLARRLVSGKVVPISGAEDDFNAGLKKLRASVEGVDDPAKRHFFFEENGTGYIAQRKTAVEEGGDEGEERAGPRMAMIIGIAAALVVLVALGVIWLINFLTDKADEKINGPATSVEDVWTPPVTPSPTPYVQATFGTITDPQLSWMDYTNRDLENPEALITATPMPTMYAALPTSQTIKSGSNANTIRQLQELLTILGWLDENNITGAYDDKTKQAVMDFQRHMNENYAISPKLAVDGIAGQKTLAYLTDISVSIKPAATPVPLTPSPTMNYAIDANSPPAQVRYLQSQLITLGLMNQNGLTGGYDSATRAAVLAFQQRVNRLQGYAVLPENGACDATTLAYVDFYADWWLANKPTPAPTTLITPEPTMTFAPEPEAGDYVDENSNAESIKFVQEMLIELGYLDGRPDGNYGPKTYSAVKGFQNFLNAQMPGKVTVTGKCDTTTLSFLEYYYVEHEKGGAPDVSAPAITVTGATVNALGVYCIGQTSANINWTAENAHSYSVYLNDSRGASVRRTQSTQNTQLELSRSLLTPGEVYTFIVIALPRDGDEDSGARASINIMAETALATIPAATPTPTPAPTGDLTPVITVSGALNFQNGVYGIPAAGAKMSWVSDGAQAYSLYLTNALGETIDERRNTTLTEYAMNTATLTPGEKYTFTVAAIPLGGVEAQGKLASVRITLAGAQPTEEPTPTPIPIANIGAPEITVSGALGFGEGIYWVGESEITISWRCEGDVSAFNWKVTDSRGTPLTGERGASQASFSAPPSTMKSQESYTFTVMAIPAGGTEQNGKTASIVFQLFEGQTPQPDYKVEKPVITVSGHVDASNGVYYASVDALTISWSAAGDLGNFAVYCVSSSGDYLINEPRTSRTSFILDPANIAPNETYTLTVVAIPINGEESDGELSSVGIAIKTYSVDMPAITVEGHIGMDGDQYIAGDANLLFNWHSAGDLGYYNIYLLDVAGNVINSQLNTSETRLSVPFANAASGETYIFRVQAVPINGDTANAKTSDIRIRKQAIVSVSAPTIEITGATGYENGAYIAGDTDMRATWSVEGEAEYYYIKLDRDDGDVIRPQQRVNQAQIELPTGGMTPGETYVFTVTAVPMGGDESRAMSASVRLYKPAPSAPALGNVEMRVTGNASFSDGVYYAGANALRIEWRAEGASEFDIYLIKEDGATQKSELGVANAAIDLPPDFLEPGMIYTFRVEARAGGESRAAEVYIIRPRAETPPVVDPGVPEYIDAASNVADIEDMQLALYNNGWLNPESGVQRGILDAQTLQAVYDFQTYVLINGYNLEITPVDLASPNPIVDYETLMMLFDEFNPITKPTFD